MWKGGFFNVVGSYCMWHMTDGKVRKKPQTSCARTFLLFRKISAERNILSWIQVSSYWIIVERNWAKTENSYINGTLSWMWMAGSSDRINNKRSSSFVLWSLLSVGSLWQAKVAKIRKIRFCSWNSEIMVYLVKKSVFWWKTRFFWWETRFFRKTDRTLSFFILVTSSSGKSAVPR